MGFFKTGDVQKIKVLTEKEINEQMEQLEVSAEQIEKQKKIYETRKKQS